MMAECRRYIGSEFLDVLKARCGEILGATDAWSLHVTEQDPNVVQFRYPTAVTKNLDYVSPQVVLELGTHAEFVPHDRFTIRSFAAEEFPNVVVDRDVAVVALLAKRTFGEKATILHAEYYRPAEKPIGIRDLMENELVEDHVRRFRQMPTMNNVSANQRQFMREFPAHDFAKDGLNFTYIPVKISAPDVPLEQMLHPTLSGRRPVQVFEEFQNHRN